MKAASTLLEIQSLDLAYSARFFKQTSIKDTFISAFKSPLAFLVNKEKTRPVLKNLNFKVDRGDRVALVGINGSGKTSLCRCIAGTLKPNNGIIKQNCSARVIMQTDCFFFPELTGEENAYILAEFLYQDFPATKRKEIVEESLDFSGLGNFRHSPVETYSMGMKSRLSLSLATAHPQELLVLDEVYTHADEFFQQKIRERFKNQIKSSGAVIIVSHYEKDLMELCNRGVVLQDGEIKYDGSVETALRAYRLMNGSFS